MLPLILSFFLQAQAVLLTGPGVTAVDLTRGQPVTLQLPGGAPRTLKLISLEEITEPYFESATGSIARAVVEARLIVELDGKRHTLTGGPFHMPAAFDGLWFLVACTRGWTGGISADPLTADLRLEIASSSDAWNPPSSVFPVRNYRWRVMNYQHTCLALAVNQARLYYHRGEDFGMVPDLEQALSLTSGEVSIIPGPKGDGRSNSFVVAGTDGLQYRYAHMNAPHIDPALKPETGVSAGRKLGLTGNTWQGGPVSDPHLHLDVTTSSNDRLYRHSFPIIAAAYRATYSDELLPVAGGWRHVWAGGELALNGTRSLPARNGGSIVSYSWTFSDGSTSRGPLVQRRYAMPGAYTETLTIRDDKGRTASDSVEVFVLSPEQRRPPPYAWINYYPIRGLRTNDQVRFQTRFAHMKDVTIDFGDGHRQPYALDTMHRYSKPGSYTVTVRGQDSGSGPGVFHVRVVVD